VQGRPTGRRLVARRAARQEAPDSQRQRLPSSRAGHTSPQHRDRVPARHHRKHGRFRVRGAATIAPDQHLASGALAVRLRGMVPRIERTFLMAAHRDARPAGVTKHMSPSCRGTRSARKVSPGPRSAESSTQLAMRTGRPRSFLTLTLALREAARTTATRRQPAPMKVAVLLTLESCPRSGMVGLAALIHTWTSPYRSRCMTNASA
jgi:hypothetical protein